VWDGQADPALPALQWAQAAETLGKRCLMSNSFAFGGNNVSLIIGEAP
jgi:3-oxoacyl-[acyl-carrier-protein] synthase-1